MPANIDFFSTYVLMAVTEEIVPQTGFSVTAISRLRHPTFSNPTRC